MTKSSESTHAVPRPKIWRGNLSIGLRALAASLLMMFCGVLCSAQSQLPSSPEPQKDNQINVNWIYGSYVPKEVPLESLNPNRRFKLYLRQTYTTPGIYVKTTCLPSMTRFIIPIPNGETVSMHSPSDPARGRPNS